MTCLVNISPEVGVYNKISEAFKCLCMFRNGNWIFCTHGSHHSILPTPWPYQVDQCGRTLSSPEKENEQERENVKLHLPQSPLLEDCVGNF